MKILIPASGGVNSAYSLHQFLSTTDHEIVALHFTEGYDGAPDERAEFDAVCDWLTTNVRTFERSYVTLPKIGKTYDMRPVRAGFAKKVSFSFATARYGSYATQIGVHEADAIAIGISVENSSTDRGPGSVGQVFATGAAVYLPSISITDPVAKYANYDDLAAQMSGSFEQLEALPSELRSLVTSCDVNSCTNLWCLRCAYQRGYEHFVENGLTGRDFDLWCAEQGAYGQWRSEADPAEYGWRGGCCDECAPRNYLADLVGREWPSVIDNRNQIAWFSENGADMSGIETEQQLGDFYGRMGRINLDRGVNIDAMDIAAHRAATLQAALL
jgi:hypothetical protein